VVGLGGVRMIDWITTTGAVGLAVAFFVAVYTKLATWNDTKRWITNVGLIWPTGVLILSVVCEATLSLLLVVWPKVGGVGVVVWLVPTTALLHRSLRRGLPCSCFGGGRVLGSSRRWPLIRNGILAIFGLLLLLLHMPPGAIGWPTRLLAAMIASTVAIGVVSGRPDPRRFDPLPSAAAIPG
jgi:uncharacterized membrane protein YphA (DoxX/SURF4 family)